MPREVKSWIAQNKLSFFSQSYLVNAEERQLLTFDGLETLLGELEKSKKEVYFDGFSAFPFDLQVGSDRHDVEGRSNKVGIGLEVSIDREDLEWRKESLVLGRNNFCRCFRDI